MNQSNLFLIVLFISIVFYNYYVYQIWFQPHKMIKRFRNKYSKLPNWYPLKGLVITLASDEKAWISMNKIMSVIIEIILIAIFVIAIISKLPSK